MRKKTKTVSQYFREGQDKKYHKKLAEDGAVMSAGTGGFSSSAPATGPVAGFDVPLKNRIKKRLKPAVAPPSMKNIVSGGG